VPRNNFPGDTSLVPITRPTRVRLSPMNGSRTKQMARTRRELYTRNIIHTRVVPLQYRCRNNGQTTTGLLANYKQAAGITDARPTPLRRRKVKGAHVHITRHPSTNIRRIYYIYIFSLSIQPTLPSLYHSKPLPQVFPSSFHPFARIL